MEPSVYFITAEKNLDGRDDLAVAAAVIDGGGSVIQLRKKELGLRKLLLLAEQLRELTRQKKVPLLINDRVDLALAVEADGVHLGEDDLPVAKARELLGAGKVIGKTARTVEQARQAEADGADYIGAGAVFPTRSKSDTRVIGLSGLEAVCRAVSIPVVAVAGIDLSNARRAIAAGAAGVAVISCLAYAADIRKETAALLREVTAGKQLRGGEQG